MKKFNFRDVQDRRKAIKAAMQRLRG